MCLHLFSLELFGLCLNGQEAMGPPQCRLCGIDATELSSDSLRKMWGFQQGMKWEWLTPKQAYWFLCMQCHSKTWPSDRRTNNRHSMPSSVAKLHSCNHTNSARSKRRLDVGDFYLTESPLEFLRPSKVPRRCTPSDPVEEISEAIVPRILHTKANLFKKVRFSDVVTFEESVAFDRACVVFGSITCDGCEMKFDKRVVDSVSVQLQNETAFSSVQRDAAVLCYACRTELLTGTSAFLHSHMDYAKAVWTSACPTRVDRLHALGAPYTPKVVNK